MTRMISRPADIELIDEAALRAEVNAAAGGPGAMLGQEARQAVLGVLKRAYRAGRQGADALLLAERKGLACAERLCRMQDLLIRVIFDLAVTRVYKVDNPSAAERMAVVAVGGYGRGTLAPGSDIDLLFVLPYKQTPWGESVAEFMLYVLWDLGFKVGHATRRVDECIRLSKSDMTIRTSILEARFVVGEVALYDDLVERFFKDVVSGTSAAFIAAKLAEREERHRRQGTSRYLVEPNVKEGKGGLRDLNALFWIAKDFYQVMNPEELVTKGVFSRAEYARFRKAEDFLWAVRCNLHFVAGRADERLSFDVQPEIAIRLGYQSHPGLSEVERFMKHYFLIAKSVGDLTLIFSTGLELHHAKAPPVLGRVLGRIARRGPGRIAGTADFVIEHDRLTVASEDVFRRDPVNLIRFFHVADRQKLPYHPDALKLLTRSLALITPDLRENEEANRLFLEILTSRGNPEATLRRMNETGVLGRFIPDFGRVVAMMQFNMYHHYTVDEHTLRALGALSEIEKGNASDELPLTTEIFPQIKNRRALYLAVFVHDIAKGRPEDHSIAGARVARRLAKRFGFSAGEIDLCGWLVEQHLTMSMTAQQRDIADRKTIRDFAGVVQTIERLKLLLILTVADIRAVGPGVWNGWKGQLLRTLYYETEPYLLGGHSQLSRGQRVAAAQDEFAEAVVDWPAEEREDYLKRHYAPYWLRVDLEHKLAHAALLRTADRSGQRLATSAMVRRFEGITEITIVAPDHPRLLSTMAGACTVAGANIVDAQIFTTTDGMALDTVAVTRELPDDADELRRAERIGRLIEAALTGRERLPDSIARKVGSRRVSRAFRLPTDIRVDNALSEQFTVVEASGLDRPGLLYDLTRTLSDLNLNIASAHIATFGERAVDVFYVTDLTGQKIASGPRQQTIRRRMGQAFEASGGEPKPAKRAVA